MSDSRAWRGPVIVADDQQGPRRAGLLEEFPQACDVADVVAFLEVNDHHCQALVGSLGMDIAQPRTDSRADVALNCFSQETNQC